METINKTKGLDLDAFPIEKLQRLLQNELYIDIDSEFADELIKEINKRTDLLNTERVSN
jgi:hypothetical protein